MAASICWLAPEGAQLASGVLELALHGGAPTELRLRALFQSGLGLFCFFLHRTWRAAVLAVLHHRLLCTLYLLCQLGRAALVFGLFAARCDCSFLAFSAPSLSSAKPSESRNCFAPAVSLHHLLFRPPFSSPARAIVQAVAGYPEETTPSAGLEFPPLSGDSPSPAPPFLSRTFRPVESPMQAPRSQPPQ